MKYRNSLISLSLLLGSLTLVACGGGGGDSAPAGGGGGGGGGVTASAPTTPIAITTANADQVADESIDALDNFDAAFDAGGIVAPTDTSRTKFSDLIDLVRKSHQQATPALAVGAVENCRIGGTVTYPDSVLTFPLTVTFSGCNEGQGAINGSITVTGTGDLNGTFNGSFAFNNLTIVGSLNYGLNGTLNVSYSDNGTIETGTVSSTIIQIKEGADVTDITNLNLSYTENSSDGTSSETVNYTVNSTRLNGSVTVATTQTIFYRNNQDYPYVGQIEITGASGTTIRLTATNDDPTDTTAVIKQVNNGSTTTLSWQQLENSSIIP